MIRSMIFSDYLVLLVVLWIIISSRPIQGKQDIFARNSTDALKGACMIGIMLLHISMWLDMDSYTIVPVGYMGSGFFFFLSGYGNLQSANHCRGNIGWLWKKFIKLYVPFLAAYLLCCLGIILLVPRDTPSLPTFIINLLTMTMVKDPTWFAKVILFCFFAQWIAAMMTDSYRTQVFLVSVFILGVLLLFVLMKMKPYWYSSVLCYALGNTFALSRKRKTEKSTRQTMKNYLYGIALCIVFVVVYLWTIRSAKIWLQIPCALLFSALCYCYANWFLISSKVLSWIGRNSFEFYVFHFCSLHMFQRYRSPMYALWVYPLLVLSSAVAFVYFYLWLKNLLILKTVKDKVK